MLVLSFHQFISSSEWCLSGDRTCTLKEHKQMPRVMWNLQACAMLSILAYITLETSNVQGRVLFQTVLYYSVPAKQKWMGLYSCWFLSVKRKFLVAKGSFLILKTIAGIHSYKDEQGGCIRNTEFCRERNKIKMQSRAFKSASSPLTQADSS